ncbi:MAG: polysaccharide deacetylase family protein [Eubacteriales bacterium]|nr:polysaccharide deacetylase family protein [Eubacteriales bacterium]
MGLEYLYPEGKGRALTFSYDDGMTADRRLVQLFDAWGLKATFHLNSGFLGKDGYVEAQEVPSLYRNHEVACHGVRHAHLLNLAATERVQELWDDRIALEQVTGGIVSGMSYAFGEYSEEIKSTLRALGFRYARTVCEHGGFQLPADFLSWHPTCHHASPRLMEYAEQFMNPPAYLNLPVFYVWGHSFEFERTDTWEIMERFAEKVAGDSDVWYATNGELCDYILAVRWLQYSASMKIVHNPSALTVWARKRDGSVLTIASGETKSI